MNKEEYCKRLEKTTEKIKTDRCSEDEIANINRQKLYLAEHYISSLEQENQKYKEVIDKAIEWVRDWTHGANDWFEEDSKPSELLEILKGDSND